MHAAMIFKTIVLKSLYQFLNVSPMTKLKDVREMRESTVIKMMLWYWSKWQRDKKVLSGGKRVLLKCPTTG